MQPRVSPHGWLHSARRILLALPALGLLCLASSGEAATSLYPDLIVRKDNLYDHDLVTTIQAGHTHLRLAVGTANIGAGPLQIYGVLPDNGDGTQNVAQRIFDDAGGYIDRPAGVFVYHPQHQHVHFEGWSEYRIRQILPGNGVGPILATGGKTSFCLLDSQVYDDSLPGFSPTPTYTQCASTTQGISVGWFDVYGKTLPDQNIDVTNVPDGTYWLEVEVDPNHLIQESDETNNIARIQVVIGHPTPINPDRFEPNDSLAIARARVVGSPNSPNLGPTAPSLLLDSLTVNVSGDDDWFRFYLAATGTAADSVSIAFTHSLGDLDLELYDEAGTKLRYSNGITNQESIPLQGIGPGWYSVRILGYNGAVNPYYRLRIHPPAGTAPQVTVNDPPAGDIPLVHSKDAYAVEWTASDPQNPVWVNVFINHAPALDGNEIPVPGMQNLDGSLGSAVINSAEVPPGSWWVYCTANNGGAVTGAWSAGTVTFADPPPPPPPPAYAFQLLAPRPNPLSPSAVLGFDLARPERVRWEILDTRGRRVRVLQDGDLSAGPHMLVFDGADDRGQPLASGVYFNRVATPSGVRKQKLVLLR